MPPGIRDTARTIDLGGLALLGFGLPLLLYAATETGTGKLSAGLAATFLLGAGLVAAFVAHALRAHRPLIDLRPIRRPGFAAAVATAGLTGLNMYGGLLLIPLYLQLAAAQDTGATGLMLLVMGLGSALVLPVAGTLTDRHGPGLVALAGAVLLAATALPFLTPEPLAMSFLAAALIVRGAGLALAQMPAMTAAYAAVSAEEMGDAATLVNVAQRIGGATGAILVIVLLSRIDTGAYGAAFAALTAVSLATLGTAARLHRHTRQARTG